MRRNQGAILIITLMLIAGLVAIIASVYAGEHLVIRAQVSRMEQRRARLMAEAAVQRAITELVADASGTSTGTSSSTTSTGASTGAVTLTDTWATLGTNGADRFTVGSDSFRLQIVDACSLVNLNTATLAQLENMPLTEEQAESLVDWRSTGETASTEGGKDDYYQNLTKPYNAKLGSLDSLDELLQVKGFTARAIYEVQTDVVSSNALPNFTDGRTPTIADICWVNSYSEGTTTTGGGTAKTDVATANAAAIETALARAGVPNTPPNSMAQTIAQRVANTKTVGSIFTNPAPPETTFAAILDGFTSSTKANGKINLNTATQAVLQTIPNLPTDAATAIVQRQTASGGFTALSDILSVTGMNSATVLADVADVFTFTSKTFLVKVIGESGSTQIAMIAEIDMRGTNPRIVSMTQLPFTNMPARWGWDDVTNTTDLKQTQ